MNPVLTPAIEAELNGRGFGIYRWDQRIKTEVFNELDALQRRSELGKALVQDTTSPVPTTLSEPSKLRRQRTNNMNGTFRIAHSIKMPSGERHTRDKYPWTEMQVGDSFEAPKKAVSAVNGHNKKVPATLFEWRHWDRKNKTIRVWRTK